MRLLFSSSKTLPLLFLIAVIFTLGSVYAHSEQSGESGNDIVVTAVEAGSFNTLAAALEAAGLVETLKGAGPFTVFAPTDEAFAKLPDGTVEMLLKPENKDKLVAILTYHVVPGKFPAAEVVNIDSVKSVNGAVIPINTKDGVVMVDNATVIKPDVMASNGVIHVIDAVILPDDNQ